MSSCAEPPKIEFPCDYPIRIIGDADPDYQARMEAILEKQEVEYDRNSIQLKPSGKGGFLSMRVTIIATGKPQLEALFTALKQSGIVRMVL